VKSELNLFKRSSATAEKQRVSCAHVYLGWLTDRAMHRTPQNRRWQIYNSTTV